MDGIRDYVHLQACAQPGKRRGHLDLTRRESPDRASGDGDPTGRGRSPGCEVGDVHGSAVEQRGLGEERPGPSHHQVAYRAGDADPIDVQETVLTVAVLVDAVIDLRRTGVDRAVVVDRKSTRLNSSHYCASR